MKAKVAAHLSNLLTAMENCQKRIDNPISADNQMQAKIWFMAHRETIKRICKEYLPSGSGFNNGTHLDFDCSFPNKLVFYTSFHHMTEGTYNGWTQHRVYVRPRFDGFDITIMGKDRNDIKDFIHQAFTDALNTEVNV